jgi:hypothetical protein
MAEDEKPPDFNLRTTVSVSSATAPERRIGAYRVLRESRYQVPLSHLLGVRPRGRCRRSLAASAQAADTLS